MAQQWQVIAQRQTEELTPNGSFESVVIISFRILSGTQGRVTIPSRLYNAEYVQSEIERVAQTMIAVENL